MRVRSDFFVTAYIRRCEVEGLAAVLIRRGAAEAGAIFVDVDHLDGTHSLYAPAPQSEMPEGVDRLWVRAHKEPVIDGLSLQKRMAREISFDADLWLIGVEDAKGRHFLEIAQQNI